MTDLYSLLLRAEEERDAALATIEQREVGYSAALEERDVLRKEAAVWRETAELRESERKRYEEAFQLELALASIKSYLKSGDRTTLEAVVLAAEDNEWLTRGYAALTPRGNQGSGASA